MIIVKLLAIAVLLSPQIIGEPDIYPPGQFCNPAGVVDGRGHVLDEDHKCFCKKHDDDPLCDGVVKTEVPSECKQWCHEDHCACPVVCDVHKKDAA